MHGTSRYANCASNLRCSLPESLLSTQNASALGLEELKGPRLWRTWILPTRRQLAPRSTLLRLYLSLPYMRFDAYIYVYVYIYIYIYIRLPYMRFDICVCSVYKYVADLGVYICELAPRWTLLWLYVCV